MAEGDSEDAWAQVAGKIIDIKDYTKKKELYLSQLLDSINGFAYPVKGLNVKVFKFQFCCGLLFIASSLFSKPMQFCAKSVQHCLQMMKSLFQNVHTMSLTLYYDKRYLCNMWCIVLNTIISVLFACEAFNVHSTVDSTTYCLLYFWFGGVFLPFWKYHIFHI